MKSKKVFVKKLLISVLLCVKKHFQEMNNLLRRWKSALQPFYEMRQVQVQWINGLFKFIAGAIMLLCTTGEPERQCTYTTPLRSIRGTIVAIEKQYASIF
jgi:hypothetical protein